MQTSPDLSQSTMQLVVQIIHALLVSSVECCAVDSLVDLCPATVNSINLITLIHYSIIVLLFRSKTEKVPSGSKTLPI